MKQGVQHEWSWETHEEAERLVSKARGTVIDRNAPPEEAAAAEQSSSWFDRATCGAFARPLLFSRTPTLALLWNVSTTVRLSTLH